MVSYEDARLKALHSLNTLASVTKLAAEDSLQLDCLQILETNLRPYADPAQQPEASTSGVFSCREANLTTALEVAQVRFYISKGSSFLHEVCLRGRGKT